MGAIMRFCCDRIDELRNLDLMTPPGLNFLYQGANGACLLYVTCPWPSKKLMEYKGTCERRFGA
jgi:hypothetical protein